MKCTANKLERFKIIKLDVCVLPNKNNFNSSVHQSTEAKTFKGFACAIFVRSSQWENDDESDQSEQEAFREPT